MENIKTKTPLIKIKDFIRDKKILIIILAVAVILAGGWWIWNSQKIPERLSYEQCLKLEVGVSEDISSIDNSCEIDSDCKPLYFSGNWMNICVNKNTNTLAVQSAVKNFRMKCPFPGVGPPIDECSCVENKCVAITKKTQEVTIATDKTEYEQGEVIKLTVKNNFDKSIWYWAKNKCKTYPAESAMRAVERSMGDIWLLYFPAQCPQESVKPIYTELKPKELVILEFKYKHFLTGSVRGEFLSKYKIVMWFSKEEPKEEIGSSPEIESYSNEFIIKEKVEQKD